MASSFDKFVIAPLNSGLTADAKPWLIPDDAFERLNNAYVFRGIVKKRFGSRYTGHNPLSATTKQLNSRLRIALSGIITDGAGKANGNVSTDGGGIKWEIGQIFSIGTEIFTVVELGVDKTMLTSGSATVMKFDTTDGDYAFEDAPATKQVYFYPTQPVMGLEQYRGTEKAVAFDTQFVYQYSGSAWEKLGPTVAWKGDNTKFFNAANWRNLAPSKDYLFISNFNATIGAPGANDDPIKHYDETTWVDFTPLTIVGGNKVMTAKLIIPFKDRLVLLNTIEQNGGVNYAHKNRCRFARNGSPMDSNISWLEQNQVGSKGGGWIDATTDEAIISAEFIKDRLIVYFERSTWELAHTGNQAQPFLWQQLNTELGSQAMNSTVSFDKVVLTIGERGIQACNGANVQRVDEKIPDEVFQIRTTDNSSDRIAGIRDFRSEMVYWAFPTIEANTLSSTYPNKVLVYNYKNGSWAMNDDTFTAFGYFQQPEGKTWADLNDFTWAEWNTPWDSGTTQSAYKQIIAGNQHGFIVIIDSDLSYNASSLQITNISYDEATEIPTLTINDHTLEDGDFIKLKNVTVNVKTAGGVAVETVLLSEIYKISVITSDTITIKIEKDTFQNDSTYKYNYIGGGTAERVSKIDILSKQWNFYLKEARAIYLAHIDFIVNRTPSGELTIDYYPSSSNIAMIDAAKVSNSQLGDNKLETHVYDTTDLFEASLDRLNHRVYFQGEGTSVQIRIYSTDEQMLDSAKVLCDFELEGMIVSATKTGGYE